MSRTGNNRHGFSFIEVMVTIAILATGIVVIYRSFLISLDIMNHLTCRAYASTLLDNKLNRWQRLFEVTKEIPFNDKREGDTVKIQKKDVHFDYDIRTTAVGKLQNIYEVVMTISWREGGRPKQMTRQAYMANYKPIAPLKLETNTP